jgi:hypothetical protein
MSSTMGNGTITPEGESTVSYGGNLTYSFTPNFGYRINDVKVNGTSVGAVTSYTMSNVTANQTISVEFEAVVSLTLSVSSMSFPNEGGSKTFTITSNTSWTISSSFWLAKSPVSGTGSATVNVTCSSYSSGRSGTITVTGGGITRTITVIQGAE